MFQSPLTTRARIVAASLLLTAPTSHSRAAPDGSADAGIALVNMRNVELSGIDVTVAEGPRLEIRNVTGIGLDGAVEMTDQRN